MASDMCRENNNLEQQGLTREVYTVIHRELEQTLHSDKGDV